jgi:hypothetical protein
MLRYRIIRDETGEHFVISALAWLVPIEETYATRTAAQETADWLNRLARSEMEANAGARVRSGTGFERGEKCGLACVTVSSLRHVRHDVRRAPQRADAGGSGMAQPEKHQKRAILY